jgi:hypothetical protein
VHFSRLSLARLQVIYLLAWCLATTSGALSALLGSHTLLLPQGMITWCLKGCKELRIACRRCRVPECNNVGLCRILFCFLPSLCTFYFGVY